MTIRGIARPASRNVETWRFIRERHHAVVANRKERFDLRYFIVDSAYVATEILSVVFSIDRYH